MLIRTALRIHPGDVVALVGGGGKTTLMFRLADELVVDGLKVVTTMTTKIFVEQMSRAPARLVLQGEGALLSQLPGLLAEHGHVLLAGGTIVEQEKVQGLGCALIDRIAAHPSVDVIVIEADGARCLPFKAPAAHEPVIPAATSVVVPIVGLDVIGHPLTAEFVHRPERVAALTGASLGDPVTPAMVAAVLAHPLGGAKGTAAARLVPFINKSDVGAGIGERGSGTAEREPDTGDRILDAGDRNLQSWANEVGPIFNLQSRAPAAARETARLLLQHPRVSAVLIGAAQTDDPIHEVWGRVHAVVLAAGEARRYGSLKQLLPWEGLPLVAHVVRQALACPDIDRVAVTVGAQEAAVWDALGVLSGDPRLQIVAVPDWSAGQSRSVRAGLAAVTAGPGHSAPPTPAPPVGTDPGPAGAAVFLLADQPGVTPELLTALIQRHRETLAPVVAPRHAGQRGNPVLFDRTTFAAIAALTGDTGARAIIRQHQHRVAYVDWPTDDVLKDIDTPADYRPPP